MTDIMRQAIEIAAELGRIKAEMEAQSAEIGRLRVILVEIQDIADGFGDGAPDASRSEKAWLQVEELAARGAR